jgi:hypothetical protein
MLGPTHPYMESSPGCWHLYGEVLAWEYEDPVLATRNLLTADSYAVQHPGHPVPQAIQSVCLHLISLCLVLERGRPLDYATRLMAEAARTRQRFSWLAPPASMGAVTVADVAAAGRGRHDDSVRAWAESAWSAWSDHHPTVRSWAPA